MRQRFHQHLGERLRADHGFMGYTHALSALSIVCLIIAFTPTTLGSVLRTGHVWVFIAFGLAATGAVLIPDLDNTSSRAKSDLGPFGVLLSGVFRVTSTILQTTIRTKRDDPDPNPHRGAWHTIPACLLLGGGTWLLTRIGGKVAIPSLGEVPWGTVIAILIIAVLTHLALSTIMKGFMDKLKKSTIIGEAIALGLSLAISVLLVLNIPHDTDFWWLGVAVAFGSFVHVLGDCFTTAGAPILFPLSGFIKGKFWWTTRFLPIKAGGPVENYVFVPLFIVGIVVAVVKIVWGLVA